MFAFSQRLFIPLVLVFLISAGGLSNVTVAAEQEASSPQQQKATEAMADEKKPEPSADAKTNESQESSRIVNAPINAFSQQQQDIKHYLTHTKVESILVGPDEYLMLVDPHTTAINKGVMILIPDWQKSPTSPSAFKQLRKNMPNQGWTLLTLHPPHQPTAYPSQALSAEQREQENSDILMAYQKTLASAVTEVIKKAKNYPGVILTIVAGQHAGLMMNMISSEQIDTPSAMVMLSGYMSTPTEDSKLAEQVGLSDLPILDLYLKRDHRLVANSAKTRKIKAKNEMKVYYRQRQLTNQMPGQYPKYSLTKTILGWLKSIGW